MIQKSTVEVILLFWIYIHIILDDRWQKSAQKLVKKNNNKKTTIWYHRRIYSFPQHNSRVCYTDIAMTYRCVVWCMSFVKLDKRLLVDSTWVLVTQAWVEDAQVYTCTQNSQTRRTHMHVHNTHSHRTHIHTHVHIIHSSTNKHTRTLAEIILTNSSYRQRAGISAWCSGYNTWAHKTMGVFFVELVFSSCRK